jgi:hypothetical protein
MGNVKFIKLWQVTSCILLILISSCTSGDSEKELRKQFAENIDTLIKLEAMQRKDLRIAVIRKNYYEQVSDKNGHRKTNVGMTAERWNEYIALFNQASIEYGLNSSYNSARQVTFLTKEGYGFTYSEAPLTQTENTYIYNSFNECNAAKHKYGICYVLLQKNWYMYRLNGNLATPM